MAMRVLVMMKRGACEENEHSGADNRDEGSGGGAIYAQPERRDVQQQQQAGPQCAAQEGETGLLKQGRGEPGRQRSPAWLS